MVGLLPPICRSLIIDCLDFDISNQQLRMAIVVETNKWKFSIERSRPSELRKQFYWER
ncbi:MAG: hypothetical protein V7K25_14480 [Nostoc sp.]|uniref:hypothetical protein n=1 Tax=Nostoc sp. TaxID=1180 RepID=UPI002FF6498D